MKRPEVVIAGSFAEFKDYCRENDMVPNRDAVYASRMENIKGRRGSKLVLHGLWRRNPLASQLGDVMAWLCE